MSLVACLATYAVIGSFVRTFKAGSLSRKDLFKIERQT